MRLPLLLNGFMATGKSSLGQRLAQRTGRPFLDLDAEIEVQLGTPLRDFFAQRGESEFRSLERRTLLKLLHERSNEAPVIALGGGALLSRELRLQVLDEAVVVTLEASVEEVLRRAEHQPARPLLQGSDPAQRARELLDLRASAYAEAHARIRTDGRELDALTDEVLSIWRRGAIAVAAGTASYVVEIGRDLLQARLGDLLGNAPRSLLVSDATVLALHGSSALTAMSSSSPPLVVELLPGEEHKKITSVERIWEQALGAGADRSSCFVALGGGVVSDITGFAAATYMRGVRWVCVPTTLLAMVDASVGGKTGVDLLAAKNAVGAFHHPSAVLCDVDLLRTESDRGFRGALAEVVKTAIIGDAALLDLLERDSSRVLTRDPELVAEIVRRSIRVKARIVGQDPKESGVRAVLNLGHTVGHALEAHAGYTRLSHGEAVSLGLVAALRLGVKLGFTDAELARRIEAVLARLGLPVDLGAEPLAEAAALISHDKKRAGKRLRFVVARAVEQVETTELELDVLKRNVLALQ